MENFFRESGVKWLWERIKTLLSAKQDKLVSGTNIKTINGTSLLGSGDVSIEGGGDFDSSGTYPNLTAGKATKLATARTISLSGGASGSASFDGSTAINIPVTSLNEGKLTWSKGAILNGISPFDAIFRDTLGNKISFLNPDAINIEYSRDNGVTWVDYGVSDANKKKLVTPACGIASLYLGKEFWITSTVASNQLRITIDAITGNVFFIPRKILISSDLAVSADRSINCVKIEYALYGSPDVWETHFDGSVYGQPGWSSYPGIDNAFGYAAKAYIRYIRLTFYRTGTPQYLMAVTNIAFISNNMGSRYGNNLTAYGHIYSMDVDQNATFPANVTATKHITQGGSANQVVLGNGSLRPISELSPITDADADILLDNHIHSINVNANGNDVNINVIESSKNGDTWETEDNDIPIPLATPTSAGVMSKEDKIKSDGLLIYYHLTEDEYTNHEVVSLYPLVLAIKDKLFNSTTNKWKYDDSKSYDVRVKGWTIQDNGITYLNVNVRLLTSQGGHSIGFSGFADVDFITETYFDALIPLYIGYICGKYHIENDGMTIVAPEDSGFYIEI